MPGLVASRGKFTGRIFMEVIKQIAEIQAKCQDLNRRGTPVNVHIF
jgi:hypothetical protein